MTISFTHGNIFAPDPVNIGWTHFNPDYQFEILATFPVENGLLQTHSITVADEPSMYGQVAQIQFPGFSAYGDPLPGPGIDIALDLGRIYATEGTIEVTNAGTYWHPVPEPAIGLLLAMGVALLRRRIKL